MTTLPAIPPVADSDRSVTYAPGGASTTLVDIPFPVYGDETDLAVYLDGALLGTGFYGLASKSGVGVSSLPQPLTDAQVFFDPPVTPNVIEIVGSIRPRQTVMPSAAQIGRREFNSTVGYVLSALREFRAKIDDLAPVISFDAKGPLSGRPAAGSVDAGYTYLQTDDGSKRAVVWISDGAAWSEIILTGPTGADGADGAAGAPGASTSSFRNRLINGNFAINQTSHTSGLALAAGVYGHDGWKAGAGGCTYTFSATTPDTTITITAGTLKQIVESSNVEGGDYILSWIGTATASINGGAIGASPRTVTGIGSGVAASVEFGTGTVGLVQLEPGTSASVFERRPLPVETALAQRYFRWVPVDFAGYSAATYKLKQSISFPPMRINPTIGSAVADPAMTQVTSNVSAYGVESVTKESAVCFATLTLSGLCEVTGYRVALDARL